ncbi:MAG: formylglycine-generating enzyme family protein [Flavisolibacter sp.]
MRRLSNLFLSVTMIVAIACSQKPADEFILIKGGSFKNTKSNYFGKTAVIKDFYIGKYELTQKEWMEVMPTNPSEFKGDDLPVEMVSWYDCIDYCNKRSMKEHLKPYYNIDRNKRDSNNTNVLDEIKWMVTINENANGYRLPTEKEWEYAASGGQLSNSYAYSGSNNVDDVAWYWKNSGDQYLTGYWSWPLLEKNHNKTKAVGTKQPNELGLYDISGNVREWCWDWKDSNVTNEPQGRIWKGGGWIGADFCCEIFFRAAMEANGKGPDQGFRVCRNSKTSKY